MPRLNDQSSSFLFSPQGGEDYTIKVQADPKRSKWCCSLERGFWARYHPIDGQHPNWFHRWTQRLILGIYWRRDP